MLNQFVYFYANFWFCVHTFSPTFSYLSIYPFCSTLIMSITCSCAVSARVKRKIVEDKKCNGHFNFTPFFSADASQKLLKKPKDDSQSPNLASATKVQKLAANLMP